MSEAELINLAVSDGGSFKIFIPEPSVPTRGPVVCCQLGGSLRWLTNEAILSLLLKLKRTDSVLRPLTRAAGEIRASLDIIG